MKLCNRLFVLLFLSLIPLHALKSQWLPVPQPQLYTAMPSDNVIDFFKVGNRLYATVKDQGIFTRRFADSTWQKISNHDYYNRYVRDSILFFHKNGLYALNLNHPQLGSSYLFTAISTSITADVNYLYCSNPYLGMFKLNLNTLSGNFHHNGLPSYFIYPQGFPQEVWSSYAILRENNSTLYLGTSDGVYSSSASDSNWTKVGAANSLSKTVHILKKREGKYYSACNTDIYESDDLANWTRIFSNGSRIKSLDRNNANIVVLADNNYLWHSQDTGQTWQVLNLPFNKWHKNKVSYLGDSLVVCSQSAGVFYYYNNTWSWEGIQNFVSSNLINEQIKSIRTVRDTLIAQSYRGIFNLEKPTIWKDIGERDSIQKLFSRNDSLFYSYFENGTNHRVKVSGDLGKSWSIVSTPIIIIDLKPNFSLGQKYLYYHSTVSYARAFRKAKVTSLWEALNSYQDNGGNFEQLVDFKDSTYFIQFHNLPEPQVVQNAAQRSVVYNYGLPRKNISRLFPTDSSLFAYCEDIGLFKTSGLFKGWTYSGNGLIANKVHAIMEYGTVLIAATDNGVFNSADEGGNWTSISGNLGNTAIIDLAILADTLYAVDTSGKLWKRDLINASLRENTIDFSDLKPQVYPNPTFDYCEIKLAPMEQLEGVEFYDLQGILILKSQSSNLNLSNLNRGLYLLNIQTNLRSTQLKLLLK